MQYILFLGCRRVPRALPITEHRSRCPSWYASTELSHGSKATVSTNGKIKRSVRPIRLLMLEMLIKYTEILIPPLWLVEGIVQLGNNLSSPYDTNKAGSRCGSRR